MNPRDQRRRRTLVLRVTTLLVLAGCQHQPNASTGEDSVDPRRRAESTLAIAAANRYLAENPNDADAFLIRAEAENEVGEYAKAIADCDRSIALDAHRDLPFGLRAEAKAALGDYDGAIADYDRASARHTPANAATLVVNNGGPSDRTYQVIPVVNSLVAHTLKSDWYRESRVLAVAGRAMVAADRAIARNSRESTAFTARGLAKGARDDPEGALADFDQALTLDPKDATALRYRGMIRDIQSHFADACAQESGGIASATHAISQNKNDAAALIARGSYLANRGQHKAALADFNQAIAINPDYAGVLIHRGFVRMAQADPTGSIADFQQAITLADRTIAADPKNAHAFANRANARQAAGDLRGAIADYDRALALNPNDADVILNRGLAKDQQGDRPGALADFNQANKIPSLVFGAGVIPRNAKAIREAIDSNPTIPQNFSIRGAFRYERGDRAGGVTDVAYALALVMDETARFTVRVVYATDDPLNHVGPGGSLTEFRQDDRFIQRGASRFGRAGHDRAVADYDRSIALNPNDATTYFFRGVAKQDEEQEESALADYDRAISLDPNYTEALANRGTIRSKKGDLPGAVADYDRIIARHPEDAVAYEARSIFKRRQGDEAGATADIMHAFELLAGNPGDPFLGMFVRMRRPNMLAPFIENPPTAKTAPTP